MADVAVIMQTVAGLASPPWVMHQECWIQKEEASCDVPHGKIDFIIGRPSVDSKVCIYIILYYTNSIILTTYR